jgi:chromosome condensin MukBEF complex kleisin-like MukF subunit
MLCEIKLQLSVNSGITDFYVHSEEISKLCMHLVINLSLVGTNMSD